MDTHRLSLKEWGARVVLALVFALDVLLKFIERKTKIPCMDIETRR